MRVMGVDPGSSAIGFAISDGVDVPPIHGLLTPKQKHRYAFERLPLLIAEFRRLLSQEAVDYVYVEEPIYAGSFTATLALGMVVGALAVVLTDHGIGHSLVTNKVWKKYLIGRGNATKGEVAAWVKARFPCLEKNITQDEIDALAIAQWGRLTFRGEPGG